MKSPRQRGASQRPADRYAALRRVVLSCITCTALLGFGATAPVRADDQHAGADDPLWTSATKAYRSAQFETGHLHLKNLVEKHPGDVALALKCTERIMLEAARKNPPVVSRVRRRNRLVRRDNHWAVYAARRICDLERIGAVSANRATVQEAFEITVRNSMRQGRRLEAVEMIDRFVKENPHDPFWRISEANFYREIDSSKTRPLYDKLRAEVDLDHPDARARKRWTKFSVDLQSDPGDLPHVIRPLSTGSPLPMMEPDDPDGEWAIVADRRAGDIAIEIDRLAAKSLIPGAIMLWRDMSGMTDPARALDLHLLSQKQADLEPLRKLQAQRYAQESIALADSLAMFRRYPWALPAQQRLLALANRELWAGRAQSALRSFQDLLDHATDAKVRDTAQVGYWAALAQTESLFAPRTKRFLRGANNDYSAWILREMLGGVDPNRGYTWLGKPIKADALCKQLLASKTRPPPVAAVALKDLRQHVVHLPPVSPWSTNLPSAVDLTVTGRELLASGRDMLVVYNASAPNEPVWSSLQRQHAEENRSGGYYPGYFRPQFDDRAFYTRWGFSSVPRGIAAFDRATGQPLWSNEGPRFDSKRRRRFDIPLGDPVLADGLLYYLQWNTQHNVNHGRGRRLSIVCFDPRQRTSVWQGTIAEAGYGSDISASLERSQPASAIYGNRVTIHRGAIYSNSNCGIVARSDVRDGRTDWIYYYRRDAGRSSVLNLGSPPVIAGDKVIFMPRNARRIFALDQNTGRLVWENLLVMGVELVGTTDGLLIVRGESTMAGLDLETGEVRWYRPMDKLVLGRAQLSASSIYLAQLDKLLRLDAKSGHVEEVRPWNLKNERPQNFTIHERELYVVTDKPGRFRGQEAGQPLNPSMPAKAAPLTLPLVRAWTLPRDNAKLTMPPKDSPLHGSAFLISAGILECIDVTARGRVRWQRFIDTQDPRVDFVGKTMLVIDQVNGRVPGMKNRVTAYDAADGHTLWELALESPVRETLNCGPTQIFHDAKSRIVAVDLATGRRAWKRDLSAGVLMMASWNAGRLDIFSISRFRSAHHLHLDPRSGETLSEGTIKVKTGSTNQQNGQLGTDGYYKVTLASVRARYVRLVALSEVNGQGWTSIAELQVVGSDGKDLARNRWRVQKVDSFESKSVTTNADAKNAIDNDPVSWWHTQWIGGIPRHPHDIQIDMGAEHNVAGMRYLPAAITNNNGMIRDYELYVSKDGKNWGSPVAKGYLVNRVQVDRAYAAGKAVFFETSGRWQKHPQIFRYSLDDKPARMVRENGRIVLIKEPYFVTTAKNDKNQDVLMVHRLDNDGYRFELGLTQHFDANLFEISGDRMVLGRKGVLVADLAKKRFIVAPSAANLKHNRSGLIVREGAHNLLKFIHQGNQGQAIFRYDLRTGKQTEFVLTSQIEAFRDPHQRIQRANIQHFDGVILLNDNSAVTAWIAGGGLKN